MTGWMKKLKKNKKLRREVCDKFEVNESWIDKFLVGTSDPHPTFLKQLMDYVINYGK